MKLRPDQKRALSDLNCATKKLQRLAEQLQLNGLAIKMVDARTHASLIAFEAKRDTKWRTKG